MNETANDKQERLPGQGYPDGAKVARSGGFTYKLRKLGAGSDQYGRCEVCWGACDVAYVQGEHKVGYTGPFLFGHEACLVGARRRGS